jgi:hypothetical protein
MVGMEAKGCWAPRNIPRGEFSSCVVKGMIGRGCGRKMGPVDVLVSALDTTVVVGGGIELHHLPELIKQF